MIAVALVALLAFFVQGFAGFGAALIMTPLLLLLVDLQTAVVAGALAQVPVGIWLTSRCWRAIDVPLLRLLLPISLLGIVAGSFGLARLDLQLLQQVFGVLTVIFALRILLLAGRKLARRPWPRFAGYLAGATGGLLGGLFGTSGPPVVVYLENQLQQAATIRATLLAYFLILNLVRLATYGGAGLFDSQNLLAGLVMLPAALLGGTLGARLQGRAPVHIFRLIVGAILLVTGVMLALG